MKILQINNFEQLGGGSEKVYQMTVKTLLDHGHEVATLSCGDKSFDDRKYSILLKKNSYLNAKPLRVVQNVREFIYRKEVVTAIEKLAYSFKPDIAHLHIFYGQLSSSVLSALSRLKIPCVMTVHEYRLLCPVSTLYLNNYGPCEKCATGSKLNALINQCNKGSLYASLLSVSESYIRDHYFNYLDYVDHFFMVSNFCRRKHIEYMPRIEKKSSVLYNFIKNEDIATVLSNSPVTSTFIYAGRISSEKGVDLLCSVFRERPDLRLNVAGDGPLLSFLQKKYKECDNIIFMGRLTALELRLEIIKAKFSICPSEWYENNPMSILESFSLGTPVIGASIGGIPELVKEGLTGLLFKASERISLLDTLDRAHDMTLEERNNLGKASFDLINEQHSEKAYYNKLNLCYINVINNYNANNL